MPKNANQETGFNIDSLKGIEIRTMKKDILWIQGGGKEREKLEKLKEEGIEEVMEKREEEEKKTEEKLRQAEEAIKRAEEEKKKEEARLIAEAEGKEKEEEERRRMEETQKKVKEEEERMKEELRKKGEERMKIEEEKKRIGEEKQRWAEELSKKIEEEKRKIEEEKRRIEEELTKIRRGEVPEKPKISLEDEKIRIEKELQKIAEEKKPFELKKAELLEKLKPVGKAMAVISKKEEVIKEELGKIEEKERLIEEEKEKEKVERKRWEWEEKRKAVEKERWPWDEEKRKIEKQSQELDLSFQEVLKREEGLKKKQREIFAQEELANLEREKYNLQKAIEKIEENKNSLAIKREELYKNLVEIKDTLGVVLEKERKIEEDKMLIEEEEEELVAEGEEKQRLEKERWEIEEKRRKTEKEKWALEKDKRDKETQIKRLEMHFQELAERMTEINEKIKEIDLKLKPEEKIPEIKEGKAEKKVGEEKTERGMESEEVKEEGKVEEKKRIEERTEGVEEVVKEDKSSSSPFAIARVKEEGVKEEKEGIREKEKIAEAQKRIEEAKKRIEALKREGERKQREEELKQKEKPIEAPKKETVKTEGPTFEKPRAEKEHWERLKKEWEELEKEKIKPLERIEKKEEVEKPPFPQPPVTIVRPLPQKPSFKERLGMRIVIILLILAILAGMVTFWYWFFKIRRPVAALPPLPPVLVACQVDDDCPNGKVCQAGSCVAVSPVAEIPPSLLAVDDTIILSISSSGELRNSLLQKIQDPLGIGQLKRVVIKNITENKVLGLRDFFEALLMRAPEELYQKLDNDFTLFIYSQLEGKRIGFVARIKNSAGLADLLTSREPTMENDFQTFFELVGKQSAAIVPYFRNSSNVVGYTGPNFRFQSLTREDVGIYYLIAEGYFVFTSSWKSMEKTITKLALTGKPLELTSELKLKNSGKEVELLQTWLKQDPVVYPQGSVTGYFGELTQQAVIRFQEKYAAEILSPQGFSKGTGIVDLYTRIKLNEIYGKSGIIPTVPEITIDLRYGDHGGEVKLLQTWLAKNQIIYPEGIISGWFGYATQRAVIRFQEKYASDILAPQGLGRGTGIVDIFTRKKLNQLYGNK